MYNDYFISIERAMMKNFLLLTAFFFCLCLSGAEAKAPYILLFDREYISVNIDGTYTRKDECRYRVLNHDGVKKLRKLSLHFNSSYGKIEVAALSIVKPDGRRIKIDPEKNSSVNTESSQITSAIFDPAQKVLSVTVPDLEVGDILEVTSLEKVTKSRLAGEFSDIAVLQADFPIEYYEYTVDMPENKPLKSICIKDGEKGTVSFSEERKDGRIKYRWIARNVPQAVPESAMPAMYTCIQRVLTSTVASWEDISRWYDKLCIPRLARVNDNMRKKTAELISGKKTDMEKITAIFQFVSQQIRYTGITSEENAPGYEPHDVDQTFERRHGVCRDKAALLVAMLRIAGFKAYPVLFMSGTPKDKEVPNIYFNHAIAGVEKAKGEYILMDPTFETTAELFPGYLAGDSFLAAKPDGDTLRTAPAEKAEDHLLKINTEITAASDPAEITMTLDFSGVYDQMYRNAFSTWNKEDIQEFFASRINSIMPGAELKSVTVTPENIRDMSKLIKVVLHIQSAGFLRKGGVPVLVNMPRGAFAFGLMSSLYANTALVSRRFPLKALPRAVDESITIRLPEGNYRFAFPEKTVIEEKGLFRVKSETSADKNVITEKFFFAIDSMLIQPADYSKFKAAAGKAKELLQILPVIQPDDPYTAEGAECEYLKFQRHCNIIDAENMEEKYSFTQFIRNYMGMSANSNRSISYVDGLEKVDVSAAVTDSGGKKHILSDKEVNRMDDKRISGAPRYHKRKVAVISYPGVGVGSTIESSITVKRKLSGFFNTALLTADNYPYRSQELIIEAPARMKFAISPIPEKVKDSATFGGKRIIRRYTATDLPRLPYEPGQPEYALFVPALQIASGNYAEFFRQVNHHAFDRVEKASAEIAILANKIAETAPDIHPANMGSEVEAEYGREKMRKLSIAYALEKYTYIHIRNIDLPLNEMFFDEYSLPQTTLRDGYGNSVDRAILLAAMLKSQGIKFEFIPASDIPFYHEKLRALQAYPENIFDKLILYLPETGTYLNDSGLYGTPGVIHRFNKIIFDGKRLTTPSRQWESRSGLYLNCDIILAGDLSAKVKLRYGYEGSFLEEEKERFANFTPPLKKQYFEKIAAAVSPEAKVVSAAFDPAAGEQLEIILQIPGFGRRNGKFVSFPLPEYRHILANAAIPAKKRNSPLLLDEVRDIHLNYSVSVPESFILCRNRGTGYIDFGSVYWSNDFEKSKDGRYIFELELNYRQNGLLYPDASGNLQNIVKEINHNNTKYILFTTE